jgi:hypothetical protein
VVPSFFVTDTGAGMGYVDAEEAVFQDESPIETVPLDVKTLASELEDAGFDFLGSFRNKRDATGEGGKEEAGEDS